MKGSHSMMEILTGSGAIITTPNDKDLHPGLLDLAINALGGELSRFDMDLTVERDT